jgi:hypothetical protein
MYLVTVMHGESHTDIAGIFDTEEKANEAMGKISSWMTNHECDDYAIYIIPCEVNHLAFYN